MAIRPSRNRGQLRTEIRRLVREPDENNSGWTNPEINDVINRMKDLREMQLQGTGEGFSVSINDTDLITDQAEYSLPEESGRVRRVIRFIETLGLFVPLEREEKIEEVTWVNGTFAGLAFTNENYVPTYRILDNHIILSPPPTFNLTDGLRIEMESATQRLDEDTDTLPGSWPIFAETLLVYDSAVGLYDMEYAQIAPPEGIIHSLVVERDRYERQWWDYIQDRSFGPSYSQPLDLGS